MASSEKIKPSKKVTPMPRMPGNSRAPLYLLIIGLTTVVFMCLSIFTTYSEASTCSGVTMMPKYYEIDVSSPYSLQSSRYKTYLYREGGVSRAYHGPETLGGVPVVFIPGNAGSFNQGRSLAALAATLSKERGSDTIFDFFLLDFDEDLSALHGKTLLDQAQYTNDAIGNILSLYNSVYEPKFPPPTSVVIVGHSMGGIVARTTVTLDNFLPNSVNMIYTLSTPNIVPPLTFDRDVTEVYDSINQYWRNTFDNATDSKSKEAELNALENLSLVSISGGHTDFMVPPDYTPVDSIAPATHAISAYTYSIPSVWRGVDHLAMVWCDELRNVVVESLFDIALPHHPQRTVKIADRMVKLTKYFVSPIDTLPEGARLAVHDPEAPLIPNSVATPYGYLDVFGKNEPAPEHSFPVTKSDRGQVPLWRLLFGISVPLPGRFVDIQLPAASSSLISLRVTVKRNCKVQTVHDSTFGDVPLAIRHWSPGRESRWYSSDDVRVFWYSGAPFVPFPYGKKADLHIQVLSPEVCSAGPSGTRLSYNVGIGIDVWATLANIAFRYRTSAVTYTFAVMIMCMLIQLRVFYSGHLISFRKATDIFVTQYLFKLCLIVAAMHVLLCQNQFRDFIRTLQFPSEWRNTSSLRASDISYDIHDILAGLNDPYLLATPVFLILMATCICLLVDRLLSVIILAKNWIGHLIATWVNSQWRAVEDYRTTNTGSRAQQYGEESAETKTPYPGPSGVPPTFRLGSNAIGLILLFFTPYQVVFLCLTLLLLARVTDTGLWNYTFLIVFVWTSIVNGPMIAVWARNVSFEWAFAFSSLSNVLAVAPSVLLVHIMQQKPNPIPPLASRPFLRTLTQFVLGYIAYYALMHGIMHTFMLHHFVNYFCAYLTLLYLGGARVNLKLA